MKRWEKFVGGEAPCNSLDKVDVMYSNASRSEYVTAGSVNWSKVAYFRVVYSVY